LCSQEINNFFRKYFKIQNIKEIKIELKIKIINPKKSLKNNKIDSRSNFNLILKNTMIDER